jgi:tetratricopeptide (TPR) repeat protein
MLAGLIMALAAGCAATNVQTAILHPAEIDEAIGRSVGLGPISGRGAYEIESEIRARLEASEFVKPAAVPREADISIKGELTEYYFDENITEWLDYCDRGRRPGFGRNSGDDDESLCIKYDKTAEAGLKGRFAIVSSDGRELAVKTVSCHDRDREITYNEPPYGLSGVAMLTRCTQSAAADVFKAVSPWVERVSLSFYKDRGIPQLEQGIELVRQNRWDEAVAVFEKGVEWAEFDPNLKPKARARAHFNLGQAYMYTGRFDQAAEQFEKSYTLTGEEEYAKQLAEVERRRAEKARLDKQLGGKAPEIRDKK